MARSSSKPCVCSDDFFGRWPDLFFGSDGRWFLNFLGFQEAKFVTGIGEPGLLSFDMAAAATAAVASGGRISACGSACFAGAGFFATFLFAASVVAVVVVVVVVFALVSAAIA